MAWVLIRKRGSRQALAERKRQIPLRTTLDLVRCHDCYSDTAIMNLRNSLRHMNELRCELEWAISSPCMQGHVRDSAILHAPSTTPTRLSTFKSA